MSSKLAVVGAAVLGAALAALHISSTQSLASQAKAAAQKELDLFKPQAVSLVQQTAQRVEGEALTHASALDLQARLAATIDKTNLPDLAKTGLKLAVFTGVSETNVDALAVQGVAKMDALTSVIIAKIQAARL